MTQEQEKTVAAPSAQEGTVKTAAKVARPAAPAVPAAPAENACDLKTFAPAELRREMERLRR